MAPLWTSFRTGLPFRDGEEEEGRSEIEESDMAGSVNKVILVGNLGKDPKVSTLNSGDKVVSFTLATSESWKDKNTGERREKTEWHNVVIYNDNLGRIVEYIARKARRSISKDRFKPANTRTSQAPKNTSRKSYCSGSAAN